MLGAIIGDIVGSRFEWHNHKSKDFDLFIYRCFFTDDSVMTLALAKAIYKCRDDYSGLSSMAIKEMRKIGQRYPTCGYGSMFSSWIFSNHPAPYNSFGNGAAMRVSSVGVVADSIEEVKDLSYKITSVTHNHPEGIKGAEATAIAVYLAKIGKTIPEIREYIQSNYYALDKTLDQIRPTYHFDGSCQGTVPQAIEAFLESTSFEDAIRNAISIGGDSDTIAAITGSIAEEYYGIPASMRDTAKSYLDDELLKILETFENYYPPKVIE